MKVNTKNYFSNRNQPSSNFAEQKINYDEILKSRNEILKQIKNHNIEVSGTNMSYERNSSQEKFSNSNYVLKNRPISNSSFSNKHPPTANMNRKSTTNLVPARTKQPKFIMKNDKNSQR